MRWKKTLLFLLFLLAGIALGTLLSELVAKVDFLSWLNAGEEIGVGYPHPITVDLSVVTFSFGFSININIIKILSIILFLWLYKYFARGIN